MASAVAVIRQAGEGEHLWFAGGGLLTMKATSTETGGAFALFEDREVLGKLTPLHAHPNDDEVLYVLEGAILAHVNVRSIASARAASSWRPAAFHTRSSSSPRPRASYV